MGYDAVEARAQSLIQGLSTYSNADVARGDYRVLDKASPPYVVLKPGFFERTFDTAPQGRSTEWIVTVELYVGYTGKGDDLDSVVSKRAELVELFDRYPTMDGLSDVVYTLVDRGEAPVPVYDETGGGPFFWLQELQLRVREKRLASGGEY